MTAHATPQATATAVASGHVHTASGSVHTAHRIAFALLCLFVFTIPWERAFS